jgi:hypothetical protein
LWLSVDFVALCGAIGVIPIDFLMQLSKIEDFVALCGAIGFQPHRFSNANFLNCRLCGSLWSNWILPRAFSDASFFLIADFVALCGAIGFTPIDFLMPCILWNAVKKPGPIQKTLNWLIIVLYSCVAVLGELIVLSSIVIIIFEKKKSQQFIF